MVQFRKIAVIGAGTMGRGIAEMLAAKGLDVSLVEKTPEKLDAAWELIEISLDKQIEKWAITATEKKLILSRIHKIYELTDIADCDLVIETISENLEAKEELFRQIDQFMPEQAIFASNTSTLSLTQLASVTNRPDRVVGLHFISPVSKIDLVEIIRGLQTSDETYNAVRHFVEEKITKTGIQVYESPGFVTSRLICTLINEALHVLTEGVASAEEIDTAMKVGYDFRYGPLEMADRFGLDSVYYALEGMFREFGDLKYRPNFLLKQMVRAGRLGTKTGEGFFRYDKEGDRI